MSFDHLLISNCPLDQRDAFFYDKHGFEGGSSPNVHLEETIILPRNLKSILNSLCNNKHLHNVYESNENKYNITAFSL